MLFAETGDYAISRLELEGERQGRHRRVLENLPGFPDNLSHFHGDGAWLALTNPRSAALDALASRPGFLRQIAWRLPDLVRPDPETTTWAISLTADGEVIDEIRSSVPDFHTATAAVELGGELWMASLHTPTLLRASLC